MDVSSPLSSPLNLPFYFSHNSSNILTYNLLFTYSYNTPPFYIPIYLLFHLPRYLHFYHFLQLVIILSLFVNFLQLCLLAFLEDWENELEKWSEGSVIDMVGSNTPQHEQVWISLPTYGYLWSYLRWHFERGMDVIGLGWNPAYLMRVN